MVFLRWRIELVWQQRKPEARPAGEKTGAIVSAGCDQGSTARSLSARQKRFDFLALSIILSASVDLTDS
jgi:hypothetical protein